MGTARNDRDYPPRPARGPSPGLAWTILIVGLAALLIGLASLWIGVDLQRRVLENLPNPR